MATFKITVERKELYQAFIEADSLEQARDMYGNDLVEWDNFKDVDGSMETVLVNVEEA